MITAYYASERKLKDIIEEYGINATPSNLVKKFPPVELSDKCVYCNCNIMRPRLRRGETEGFWRKREDYCPECNHHPKDPYCSCENCRNKEKILREKARAMIFKTYGGESPKISYEDLSFTAKV